MASFLRFKHEVVEGEFEIGKGYTGSGYFAYGGALFVWDPERERFVSLDEIKDKIQETVSWEWISKGKRVGTATVRAPVGTILKHVLFRKKGNVVDYYVATEEGFKPVNYEERVDNIYEVPEVGNTRVTAKCNELEDLGVEDCLYYVVSFKSVRASSNDKSKVEKWVEKVKEFEKEFDRLKEIIKEKIGIEPVGVKNMSINKALNEYKVCVKFPYLGKEKFKEISKEYPYDYYDKCFWVSDTQIGEIRGVAEKLWSTLRGLEEIE